MFAAHGRKWRSPRRHHQDWPTNERYTPLLFDQAKTDTDQCRHCFRGESFFYIKDLALVKHYRLDYMRKYQHRESLGERALLQQRGEFIELVSSVRPLLHQVHSMKDKLGGDISGVRR